MNSKVLEFQETDQVLRYLIFSKILQTIGQRSIQWGHAVATGLIVIR